jgi:type II secretory pathway pseudopilin PulG
MNNSPVRKFVPAMQAFTAKQRERVSAFTLLELLVVITIIIILIGFLFPAFRGVQDQAKRAQAKNDLNQIVTAVSAFYTEYGKYPVDSTTTTNDIQANYDANNFTVFDVLRYDISNADKDTVTALNPRQVVFVEPPAAKDQVTPKLGIKVFGVNQGVWFDPWGYPYKVTIDANYNGITNGPPYLDLQATSYSSATDSSNDKGVRTGVIAWSVGADGVRADNYKDPLTGVPSDDVISWQ